MNGTEFTINLSDEDLFLAIAGSGASSYPWYVEWDYDDDLRLTVRVNCEDVREGATLSPGTMRRAFEALLADGRYGPTGSSMAIFDYDWSDPECDSDIDADIADLVVQYALLGDVIFG